MRNTLRAMVREVSWARRSVTANRSAYFYDIAAFRALKVLPRLTSYAPKTMSIGGVSITYRRNRGDLQSIREVFIDEAYRLPTGFAPRTILDLGANIGARVHAKLDRA